MLKVIKNGRVYSPDDLGQKDILIAGDTILSVGSRGSTDSLPFPAEVYDAGGKMILPGIIDPHVHFIGGGGSSGLNSRTKGLVEPGKHADLIILKEPFELDGVILKGKWARKDGQTLIRDPF